MMRRLISIGLAFVLLITFSAELSAKKRGRKRSRKNVITTQGGVTIPGFSFAVDASHDARLDRLVPGYRVVNVAIVNDSFNIIMLNPEKDEWFVKVGKKKRRHPAIIDLRSFDPKAWSAIPKRAQELMAYPLAIPIGARLAIDLLVSNDVDLKYLNGIEMKIASVKTTFDIKVRE